MVSPKVFAAALLCAGLLCVSLPGSCEATGLWAHEHNWEWQQNGPWAEWWAARYAKWAKFLEQKEKLAELKKPAKKVIVVEEVPAKVVVEKVPEVVEKVPEVVKVVESPSPAPKPVVAEVPASPAAPTPVISAAPAPTPAVTTPASPAPVPTTTEAVSAANATATTEAAPAAGACTTVAAAAAATPELSTLLAAVKAAGLDATLADPNLVATIFAPTNDAFAKLLATIGLTAETVLAPENVPVLKTLLTYHVVPGVAAKSTDLTNGQTLPTLNDAQTLTVDLSTPGTVKIKPSLGDAATVVTPDVQACKAIVHVIDTVLLPSNALPGSTGAATGAATTAAPAGAAATAAPAGVATTTLATAPVAETAPTATLPAGATLSSTGV